MARAVWAALVALILLPGLASASTPASCCPDAFASRLAADLDNDGTIDFVTVNGSTLRIKLSNHRKRSHLHQVEQAVSVSAVDIDGDGDRDLVVLSRFGSLQLWQNNGSGRFTSPARLSANRAPIKIGSFSAHLLSDWSEGHQAVEGYQVVEKVQVFAPISPALVLVNPNRWPRPPSSYGQVQHHALLKSRPVSSRSPRSPPVFAS